MGAYTLLDDEPAQPQTSGAFVLLDDGPDPTGSVTENLAAGYGKAIVDLDRGARQIAPGAPTTPAAFARMTPKQEQAIQQAIEATRAEVEESKRLDAPLMDTASGITGNVAGLVATALPASFVPGANTYAGTALTGGLMGLLQPAAESGSRAISTAMGAAAGPAGKWLGGKLGDFVTSRFAKAQASQAGAAAQNATRDATLQASQKAGYVVPPTQANPRSAWNQLLESFSGKIKTGQAASMKNQEVTNRLARQALGLADDAPLTIETLKALRSQAGQAYDDIARVGAYTTDSTFKQRIGDLAASQRTLSQEVPEIASDEVLKIAQSLEKPSFSGKTVVELTKALREKAGKAFRAGDTDAGRFYRGAASEVEDLIERNLMQTGQGTQVLQAFREARQLIAKAHTVENALNEGNVVAGKLGAQLTKKKPLSGGLETAGRFAKAFPDSAKDIGTKGSSALQLSPLDWAYAAGASGLTGNPAMMAGLAARPSVRSLILSGPYQRSMTTPDYTVGMLTRGATALADPRLQRALPSISAGSGVAYAE